MSDIPTEMYVEILRRVPVEDLFRFRSVCKTWRRIIDDPTFSKQHFSHGVGQDWFFRGQSDGKIFILPLKECIYSDERDSRIHYANATNVKTLVGMRNFPVRSCNGLILLTCKKNLVSRICNPFTGETLEIGNCDQLANVKYQNFERVCSGIGYDEANDDYKVVMIVELSTYMYSVNSKEWRMIGDFPGSSIHRENGVFAYCALHWVTYSDELDGFTGNVVTLDLSSGNYRTIALPSETIQLRLLVLELYELSGCLFLCCSNLRGYFVMWMIKDYGCGDTWVKMISLDSGNIIRPLAYLKGKEQVLLYRQYEMDYWWYDVGKTCAERLGIEVNADSYENLSNCREYMYAAFSSQVFPASLLRLKTSQFSDESFPPRGGERAMAAGRLPLKILFGDSQDWPCDDYDDFAYIDNDFDYDDYSD